MAATPPIGSGPSSTATPPLPSGGGVKRPRRDSDEKILQLVATMLPPPKDSSGQALELKTMPPTPKKARRDQRPEEPKPDFPHPFPRFLDFAVKGNFPEKIFLEFAYASGDDIHTLVTQSGSKSCGAGAFLMLYTDLVRKGLPFDLSQEFWTSYGDSYLDDIDGCLRRASLTNMQAHGYHLVGRLLQEQPKDILAILKRLLEESGFPVILSITHPTLGGHWILLDANVGDDYHIRDPKSGKAFSVPSLTMQTYFDEDIGEKCLYISNKDDMIIS